MEQDERNANSTKVSLLNYIQTRCPAIINNLCNPK